MTGTVAARVTAARIGATVTVIMMVIRAGVPSVIIGDSNGWAIIIVITRIIITITTTIVAAIIVTGIIGIIAAGRTPRQKKRYCHQRKY